MWGENYPTNQASVVNSERYYMEFAREVIYGDIPTKDISGRHVA